MRASSENRTHDLFLTKEVLCLLSYNSMVHLQGLEPGTR